MQQKNLIAFMLLSAVILFGWMWLQQALFPPKPKADKNAAVDKKDKGNATKAPVDAVIWTKLSANEKHALLVAQTVASPLLLPLAARQHPDGFLAKAETVPAKEEQKPETFTLGGKDFFLTVKLTTHGAGVEQVTLNKFKGANRLGLSTGDDLHLIQEDPFTPSFLLYHYRSKDDDHPLPTLGRRTWTCEGPPRADDNGTQEIRFSTPAPEPFKHLTITKIYTLGKRDYHIGLTLEIQDTSQSKPGETGPAFRYQLTGAHRMPIEGEWYTNTYRNAVIGMVKSGSLFRTQEDSRQISFREGGDRVPLSQRGGEEFIQYAGVCNQYFASMLVVDDKQAAPADDGVDMKNILAWARPTLEATEMKGFFGRVAADKKTFNIVSGKVDFDFYMLPGVLDSLKELKENEPVLVRFYHGEFGKLIASHVRAGREPHPFSDDITVRVISEPVELERGRKAVHKFLLYHGPIKVKLLGQMGADSPSPDLVDRYADTLHLRRLTDFGNFAWWTDLLIACTNVMHWLLYLLHSILSILPNYLSYGLSIILLTVVVRGAMFPISRKQAYLSMRMQELAPELKKVQERYKTDPKGRNEAVMELYRKHNVHPLGGCLPLLLQLPVFMGLYYALQESVHFRLQPFLWIRSLAAPDMTVWWGQSIPLISDPDNQAGSLFSMLYLGPYLSILPIFAVALMLVQQKMLTPPPTDEQQEMNQKVMKYMMVVMGVMFYKVAAGLCLYFIASSLWGVAERKLLPKKKPVPGAVTAAGGKPTSALPPRKVRGGKKEIKKPDGAVQKVKDWWAELLEQARKK